MKFQELRLRTYPLVFFAIGFFGSGKALNLSNPNADGAANRNAMHQAFGIQQCGPCPTHYHAPTLPIFHVVDVFSSQDEVDSMASIEQKLRYSRPGRFLCGVVTTSSNPSRYLAMASGYSYSRLVTGDRRASSTASEAHP